MNRLVFVESGEGKVRKSSLEAVAYGKAMGGSVTAIARGTEETAELENLGKYGASQVLHANDER
jgi:electron transfer flavoprotein alpha subunit